MRTRFGGKKIVDTGRKGSAAKSRHSRKAFQLDEDPQSCIKLAQL